MNAASLTPRQVSLIHVKRSSVHSASNHLMRPAVALARYPSAPRASHRGRWVWASPLACRLATTSGRIEFTSHCGLVVHLLLLPTPPRGDAVAIGYGLGNVCPRWTCTTLISHALRRTSLRHRRGARSALPCQSFNASVVMPYYSEITSPLPLLRRTSTLSSTSLIKQHPTPVAERQRRPGYHVKSLRFPCPCLPLSLSPCLHFPIPRYTRLTPRHPTTSNQNCNFCPIL